MRWLLAYAVKWLSILIATIPPLDPRPIGLYPDVDTLCPKLRCIVFILISITIVESLLVKMRIERV